MKTDDSKKNTVKNARELPDYSKQEYNRTGRTWVEKNTAILVVHGIGHQQPYETLDFFARNLVASYRTFYGNRVNFEHRVLSAKDSGTGLFQNSIRITNYSFPAVIDIYEYYWAYCTEDKAQLSDISRWLSGVVSGAKTYYNRQVKFESTYANGDSIFIKNRKFLAWKYDLFLNTAAKSALLVDFLISSVLKLISLIPFVGDVAKTLFDKYLKSAANKLSNLLGDIVIYNVSDEKSKFYAIRAQILDGATSMLQQLLEGMDNDEMRYSSVLVAGHSLGSQIAYDALNRINLLANLGRLKNYDEKGNLRKVGAVKNAPSRLADQFCGFVTFGSPLDKIAFFLRQMVDEKYFIRQQIIDSYYCFKQKQWSEKLPEEKRLTSSTITRVLEDIRWFNYYDDEDIISGRLDYFEDVTNSVCKFSGRPENKNKRLRFSHSYYWECCDFYTDIIINLLRPKGINPINANNPLYGQAINQ